MTTYADLIVAKSRESGGGGVLRVKYVAKPLRAVWKATTVLKRDDTRVELHAWGADPDEAIYNLCIHVAVLPSRACGTANEGTPP